MDASVRRPEGIMEVWLALISAAVALGGGVVTFLKVRDEQRTKSLTERIAVLEEESKANNKLIVALQRQNTLLRGENNALIRLLGKYDEAAKESLIVTDDGGIVTEWDAAAVLMFGFNTDEAIGKDISSLIVPREVRQHHREALANTFKYKRQPRTVPIKTQAVNKNYDKFDVEVQLLPGWETGDGTGSWRYGARIRKLTLPSPDAKAIETEHLL